MDNQTAQNGLAILQRVIRYIPMTGDEALAFADFVRVLEREANAESEE